LLASVPAAAIAGSSALPAPAQAAPADTTLLANSENEEFLTLLQQFEAAIVELKAAAESKLAAEQKFFELLPPVPAKLILGREERQWMSGGRTDVIPIGRGWDRWEIETAEYRNPSRPTQYRAFVNQLKQVMSIYDGRLVRGRLVRRLLPLAETYERGVNAAARKSKMVAAYSRHGRADREAGDLGRSVARAEPATLGGLRRKAIAISVIDELGVSDAKFHVKVLGAEHLADDILRLVSSV